MNVVSGDKYRLLESIFSYEGDIAFLRSEPGYHPRIGRRHRAAKRKLAFEWIRDVQRDFEDVYAHGRLLLVQSDCDRSDLVRALWRLRLIFKKRVFLLTLRLFWNAPALDDVRLLISTLEHLLGYHCIIEEDVALLSTS